MCAMTNSDRRLWPVIGLLACAAVGTLLPLAGGPALGDHECLHAQVSREMLQTGEWMVSHYCGALYGNKPPLKSWLTAAAASLLEPPSDMPVTAFSARLPSALAGLVNVLIIWRLGVAMFGPAMGLLAGLIMASSFGLLFYANNGVMEMLVATACTFAYAQFWFAMRAGSPTKRFGHLMLFYFALGVGVLAKGPVPLAMVGVPLAVWWFANRPARLALAGTWSWRFVAASLGQQFVRALARLWLLPGVLIFVATFGWWAWLAWSHDGRIIWLWQAQFLGHASGQMLHSSRQEFFYYLPYVFGLALPWLLSVPEALASPFLKRYRRHRRPLLYAWSWWLVGLVVLSVAVASKRPHYLLATVGGASLVLAVVIARLFGPLPKPSRSVLLAICVAVPVALVAGISVVAVWAAHHAPGAITSIIVVGLLGMAGFTASAVAYLRQRRGLSLALIPATMVTFFVCGWLWIGPDLRLDASMNTLLAHMETAGIDRNAQVYWGDRRPDARAVFYGQRRISYIVTPAQIENALRGRRRDREELELKVADRIKSLLASDRPVYFVMRASNWGRLTNILGVQGHVLFTVDSSGIASDQDLVAISNRPPSPSADSATKAHPNHLSHNQSATMPR